MEHIIRFTLEFDAPAESVNMQEVMEVLRGQGGARVVNVEFPVDPAYADREALITYDKNPSNRILAIKRFRELTGWGLREAKEHVDELVGYSPSD